MKTPTSLMSMLPPKVREMSSAACSRSGGPGLGKPERVAIDCGDVEDLSGLARGAAGDLGIPLRVPVLHASVARGLVDPGLESGRLADVQPAHALRAEPVAVAMDPERAGDGEHRGGDRLPDVRAAEVRNGGAAERGDSQDEQVEGAAQQLGDDEDETCDQPDEVGIHDGREMWSRGYATSTAR